MINWPVKRMKIEDLVESPSNERYIKDSNMDGLKSSIKRFGTVELPVFNETTHRLVSGHQRIKVLKELGETECDVICVTFDEAEESIANYTMNNPKITGDWTESALELARSVEADNNKLYKALNMEPLMKDLEKMLPKIKIDDIPISKLPEPDFDMICPCCRHKWLISTEDITTPVDNTTVDNFDELQKEHGMDVD